MEPFVTQHPAVIMVILGVVFSGLLWYIRVDRAQVLSRVDALVAEIRSLRGELHELTIQHESRIAALEGAVRYHLRNGGMHGVIKD